MDIRRCGNDADAERRDHTLQTIAEDPEALFGADRFVKKRFRG